MLAPPILLIFSISLSLTVSPPLVRQVEKTDHNNLSLAVRLGSVEALSELRCFLKLVYFGDFRRVLPFIRTECLTHRHLTVTPQGCTIMWMLLTVFDTLSSTSATAGQILWWGSEEWGHVLQTLIYPLALSLIMLLFLQLKSLFWLLWPNFTSYNLGNYCFINDVLMHNALCVLVCIDVWEVEESQLRWLPW